MNYSGIMEFYKGRKVLITGHTGFKGSWLSHILMMAGAEVSGYSLRPETEPSLFQLADLESGIRSETGDIRDFEHLRSFILETRPEIVFHLAAQPIVRLSYKNPRSTYETNVMGTVNICEAVRNAPSVKSFLNVTTDKVYKNNEWAYGYRETDPLDGYDPYSNSKSCSELVTHSYISSFFNEMGLAVSTARAGNVIGGGDFSPDRIVPDCVRALLSGETLGIRNPYSIRPYQHVLEPLFVYLMIAKMQYEDPGLSGSYNVGPDESDCITTGDLVKLFADMWPEKEGFRFEINREANAPHEASLLRLDCSLIRAALGWKPVWHIDEAVRRTVSWTAVYERALRNGASGSEMAGIIREEMSAEVKDFIKTADMI